MTQRLAEGTKDTEVNTYFKVGRHSVYILLLCGISYKHILYSRQAAAKGVLVWVEV